jgi:catechol 2,3-dioxygenase-like lactoylglutathione lyase family enzyme
MHHIALATPHLETTLNFYRDVLGMTVSDIFPSERGRHAIIFAKLNDDDTWGLHVFERGSAPSLAAPTGQSQPANFGTTPLLHIAFRLLDADTADTLRARLRQHEIEITEIPELGSFVFYDPHGLMLEVTYPAKIIP